MIGQISGFALLEMMAVKRRSETDRKHENGTDFHRTERRIGFSVIQNFVGRIHLKRLTRAVTSRTR